MTRLTNRQIRDKLIAFLIDNIKKMKLLSTHIYSALQICMHCNAYSGMKPYCEECWPKVLKLAEEQEGIDITNQEQIDLESNHPDHVTFDDTPPTAEQEQKNKENLNKILSALEKSLITPSSVYCIECGCTMSHSKIPVGIRSTNMCSECSVFPSIRTDYECMKTEDGHLTYIRIDAER